MTYSSVFFIQSTPTRYGDLQRSAERVMNGLADSTLDSALTDSNVLPLPNRPRDWKRAVRELYPDARSGSRELSGLVRMMQRTDEGYRALVPTLNHLSNEQLLARYAHVRSMTSHHDGIDLRLSDLDTHRMRGNAPHTSDLDRMVSLTYAAEYPERVDQQRRHALFEYAIRHGIDLPDASDRTLVRASRQLAIDEYSSLVDGWYGLLEPLSFKRACREGHRKGGFLIGRARIEPARTSFVRSFLTENKTPHLFV